MPPGPVDASEPHLPPMPVWAYAPDGRPVGPATTPPPPLGVMTRGWAWTSLLLMALIPIGIVFLMVLYVVGSATSDIDSPPEEASRWIDVVASLLLLAWALLSTVGAALSAVIGAVRARRHPEVPRAPIASLIVWALLALGTFQIVRAILTNAF